MTVDPQLAAIAVFTSAAVFAGSAAMKFAGLAEFRAAVENYRIVPGVLAQPIAWTVPILELAGAIGLLWTPSRESAAMLLMMLLVAFTGAIAINLSRGRREIDCGCFGPILRQRLSGWLIARNLALAAFLVAAVGTEGDRALGALDYVTIASAAVSIVMLYAAVNYLLASAPMTDALRVRDA